MRCHRRDAESLTWLASHRRWVSSSIDAAPIGEHDTDEAEDHMLEHRPKGAGAMVIGPAGENLVAFACIKSDRWRSLGRGGMGAVLGSKKVKGISFAGDQS